MDEWNLHTEQAKRAIADGIPPDQLFTPILKSTGQRVVMRIKDRIAFHGKGYRGIVFDELSGRRYKIYGRDCGLDCYCDATAVQVNG